MIAFTIKGKIDRCMNVGEGGYRFIIKNGYFGDEYVINTSQPKMYSMAEDAMELGYEVEVLTSLRGNRAHRGDKPKSYWLIAEHLQVIKPKPVDIQL